MAKTSTSEHPKVQVRTSFSAQVRLQWLATELAAVPPSSELVLISSTSDAGARFVRGMTADRGATFGWHRFTLASFAHRLAERVLATRQEVVLSALGFEAICSAAAQEAVTRGLLTHMTEVARRPRFAFALARTLDELWEREIPEERLIEQAPDLAALSRTVRQLLLADRLHHRSALYGIAAEVVDAGLSPFCRLPIYLQDVGLAPGARSRLVASLLAQTPHARVVLPRRDSASIDELLRLQPTSEIVELETPASNALQRLQRHLFLPGDVPQAIQDTSVQLFSAPGESRESVEIARAVQQLAERGVAFENIAVAVRSLAAYRAHLEQAFRRAGIAVHFAAGTVRPDSAGRSFLTLLACASENLSAKRFAEYLSLGEVPEAAEPMTLPQWVPSGDDVADELQEPPAVLEAEANPSAAFAPWRWESLLLDSAVIAGGERWARRLTEYGKRLAEDLRLLEAAELTDGKTAQESLRLRRTLADLDALQRYALPIVDSLASLPSRATWGQWLAHLKELAQRTLRQPTRVLSVLAELAPMASVGPVTLAEVRQVLHKRLTSLTVRQPLDLAGRVYVGTPDQLRGMSFDAVFVPGLAEKMFPQKLLEDPLLGDSVRARLNAALGAPLLATATARAENERALLSDAAGSASLQAVFSYPRLELEQSRPRVPSFYGLEILRAAEGVLVGFEELALRAEKGLSSGASPGTASVRVGWPAPDDPLVAIDDAEHDLSLLDAVFRLPETETQGMAHFLLNTNPHLARALRFRGRRWRRRWSQVDGLVEPIEEAKTALAAHQLGTRSFSPTALEKFARCPYSFYLQALVRLAPRQEPSGIEEIDALSRGSLMHEVQYELLTLLRAKNMLPLTETNLAVAEAELEVVFAQVVRRYEDDLAPSIASVWQNGVEQIRSDLREWLRRHSREARWLPWRFELAFGLPPQHGRDDASQDEPAVLSNGIRLRGSIDLVERSSEGTIRATDSKSGKQRVKSGEVVSGGEALQPVLYALALESMFPGTKVEGGRLYYCTSKGEFTDVMIPLDDVARRAAADVATAVGSSLARGFLPAAPQKDGCRYCDYQPVCGPYEEQRTRGKPKADLAALVKLRGLK